MYLLMFSFVREAEAVYRGRADGNFWELFAKGGVSFASVSVLPLVCELLASSVSVFYL